MLARQWLWIAFLSCIAVSGCNGGVKSGEEGDIVASSRAALTGPIQKDFEDGTLQGWAPRGSAVLTNTTEAAYGTGTHSLKITGRSGTWNGPSLSLASQLSKSSTYQIKVAVRLVAGEAATSVNLTMERKPADGSATKYDSIVYNAAVTDSSWVLLSGNYQFTTDVTSLALYVESASATAAYYVDGFTLTEVTSISNDFEDGTSQGWTPRGSVTLTNTTEIPAAGGTHSLKTSGRTATWNGPNENLLGRLIKGASYQVTVSARLEAGQAATTLRLGMQRTPLGGATAYDQVATATVADSAWVTLTGIYSFPTDVTALAAYIESTAGNASFYIDNFSITLLAPPPGAPANTAGASTTFESNTVEGWSPRGSVTTAVTSAEMHGGNYALLTTARTSTWMGPSFDVSNVMFNGSRYRVAVWVKLAPAMPDNKLRLSLERKLGTVTSYTTIVNNTTVTAGAWVRLSGTFDQTLANQKLTLYVESDSSLNGGLASFIIDDFSVTYIQPSIAERDIPSVYQALSGYFPLGTAIDSVDLSSSERAYLVSKHFNSITSGNDMKWSGLQNVQGTYTFANADAQVAFAKANNMVVRGHTLIWHNQTPAWVFNDAAGSPMTPTQANQDLLTQRIQTHIQGVLTHFGNDVPVWDVINEAIDESQPDGFRRSPWFNILGPQYIDIALRAARAAAPSAKLYINDYNTTSPSKRAFLAQLVTDLKSRGVPIDGVGHQMHNNVEWPSIADITSTINLFDGLGVENEVTELDISIYSGTYSQLYNDYLDIPPDRFSLQGYQYRKLFDAFKQLSGKIKRVTIWGTSDDRTWLNTGSQINGPLLFDSTFKAKPAYWAIVDPMQLPGADVSVNMSTETATIAAGQAITFDVTVKNNPDSDPEAWKPTTDDLLATGVRWVATVPENTVFQALEVPAGWSCTTPPAGGTGQVSCMSDTLAVGAAPTFALVLGAAQCSIPEATLIAATVTVTSATRDPNDALNNQATATGQVSNPAPLVWLNGSPAMSIECSTAFSDPGASANDSCQGAVPVTTSGAVNSSQVGSYTLTYDAADAAGRHSLPVTRSVSVVDTTAPVLSLSGTDAIVLECRTPFLDPGATAADACQGAVSVVASGIVNSELPGVYTLGYSATDPSGNMTSGNRPVIVRDTGLPVMNPIDLTILAPFGVKIVVHNQTITINGHSVPLVRGALRLGHHLFFYDGTTLKMDGEPVPLDGTIIVLRQPHNEFVTFSIEDLLSAATDTCDPGVDLSKVVISRVSSDELNDDARWGRERRIRNDITITSDCKSVRLADERDVRGNGRVYSVELRVRDASGNTMFRTIKVMVPTNHSAADDDGPAYTVTSTCL